MNSSAVPTISTAWERVIDSEISRIEEKAINELRGFVSNMIMPRLPVELNELQNLLKQARSHALRFLNSMTIANAPPEKLVEMREAFDAIWEESQESVQ
jgi:hypothetical protein